MAFDSRKVKLLDGATVSNTPTGEWEIVALDDDVTIQVIGLGAGDEVQIQVSNEDNPSNPQTVHTFTGSDGVYELPDGYQKVRANVTADGANASSATAIAHKRKRL